MRGAQQWILRRRVVRRLRPYLPTALTVCAGACAVIYQEAFFSSGYETVGIVEAVFNLQLANGWAVASLGFLWLQVRMGKAYDDRLDESIDDTINEVLEAACRSLVYPHRRHIRAIATICDGETGYRQTRYSYGVEADPERVARYPVNFGVTGEAYLRRSVVCKELSPGHHAEYDLETQKAVLPEIRSILAAAILDPRDEYGRDPLGVLAFDSTLTLKTVGFDRLESRQIAQRWADIIGNLLLTRGPF